MQVACERSSPVSFPPGVLDSFLCVRGEPMHRSSPLPELVNQALQSTAIPVSCAASVCCCTAVAESVVVTELMWSAKLKIFILWSFKVCQPLP